MGTNVFVNPSYREQIDFAPEQGFEMVGKLNKVAEGGISLCKIDEHIYVMPTGLFIACERSEYPDPFYAELRADLRGLCFEFFYDDIFLFPGCDLPGHPFTSLCMVLGNR